MPTSQAEARGPDAYLKVRGVTAGYGSVPIIHNVDLSLARGEVLTVVGPNGAGKSTLVKTVLGILTPLEGTIELGGQSIAGLSPQLTHELLRDHVTRLAGADIAILLVEQHAREALAISDWACVMASGEIRLTDRASTLLERPDIGDIFLGRTTSVV